uniref:DUF5724 domain-containing protein n=1 Tax=Acetatifactor sp. TaxID=1872090 RepID=UPI00405611F4
MEYTRETRDKLYEKYLASWKKKLFFASSKTRQLAEQLEEMNSYRNCDRSFLDEAKSAYASTVNMSLSEFFQKRYKSLVQAFVDNKYQDDFYHIIDKQNQFPYARGTNRRTVRSKQYSPFMESTFQLIRDYRSLDFYGGSLEKYLRNEIPEELLDMKRSGSIGTYHTKIRYLDNMIAARIDADDRQIIGLVQDMILSDNNTAILTTEVIRGIIKSSNRELHQLLADFLVAARLQEGVRQAVCENADCGTVEAFLTIFDTICDNNLIRFAAVKRAVATWTGLGGYEDIDRITAKVVEDIRAGVDDVKQAYEFIKSNDSIHIMVGLWSLGFRNVEDSIAVMQEYLKTGTKNQILTMSYYNRQLSYGDFSQIVAKEMIKRYACTGELEYIAAFMPSYLGGIDTIISQAYRFRQDSSGRNYAVYHKIPVTDYYRSDEEAREQFGYLQTIYEALPKKKVEFSPCIFPWYSVSLSKSDVVKRMGCIAYMLGDEAMTQYTAERLDTIDSNSYPSRGTYVKLLLHNVCSKKGVDCLVKLLGDKETTTRNAAYELLQEHKLTEDQYLMLEGFLKFKNNDIRKYVLTLLSQQGEQDLTETVKRLLSDSKEEVREGGLSLVLAARKEGKAENALTTAVKEFAKAKEITPTEKEQVLIGEITGESEAEAILNQKGYGLYNPDVVAAFPVEPCDKAFLQNYFAVSAQKIGSIIEKLRALIEANSEQEYKAASGETKLLGNCFYTVTHDRSLPLAEQYPFKELWVDFYEKEIGNPELLNLLTLAVQPRQGYKPQDMSNAQSQLMGEIVEYNRTYTPYRKQYGSDYILTVFHILQSIYGKGKLRKVGVETLKYILTELPADKRWYTVQIPATNYQRAYEEKRSFAKDYLTFYLIGEVLRWNTEEEFKECFALFYEMDKAFRFQEVAKENKRQYYYGRSNNENLLGILDYVKARTLDMVPEDSLYKAVFETYGLKYSFQELGILYKDKLTGYDLIRLKKFLSNEELEKEKADENTLFFRTADRIYQRTVDCILDVELKRGEMATVFSESVVKIERFFGADRLVQILVAYGKDKLNRGQYYSWRNTEVTRQESFSHLIKACYPLPSDNVEKFKSLLKGTKVTEQRLIEVAMYAPQWMELCEEYLEYPGFRLGCYYFMAHMNEHFDDKKKAVIAKYTPLTIEELNQGAFDVNWFEEAYEKLGVAVFDKLYDAAKYISDGSKHARARKYADAALGRVTEEALEQEIGEKRNKDLLMSYGLVPFTRKEELVHRYEFIKKFQKESKQFGAQRKASETAAAEMALRNLATKAGYADITRLTLAMETELVKTYAAYFEWQQTGEVRVKIAVDELGSAELLCEKNGKVLKSIPAALKKDETVLAIKEVHKKLKDQYSRTVKMFENAMETYEEFFFEELQNLCENPVTAAVVKSLVFVTEDEETMGFLSVAEGNDTAGLSVSEAETEWSAVAKMTGLQNAEGQVNTLASDTKLRVAHAYDLYRSGNWSAYQEYFYRQAQEGNMRKQPFKQVFRELYVKLAEEQDMFHSLMFAGNQIQPNKTVACLKGRKWVADYEDGLQKVYYKQNIIARIYALADWFAPSDIEAPTLEWVEFSDRKTFRSIAIKDVPDVIYSEVMRDVDLAVSVAHAGGVDPETSHSTIEMRKVIIAFNLPLFGLKNVELTGTHAMIQGKLGRYSVHLGSGVIHQLGGHQINVLPVHSQSRGKLFLPFIDEDPKTAEIMSKIVLFAKDEKIKDPYILDQMTR